MPKRNNTRATGQARFVRFALTTVCADRAKPLEREAPEDRLLAETRPDRWASWTRLTAGRDQSSDEARARRSLVAPVQNPAKGDTLVVIERTDYGQGGRAKESRPHKLLVLATNGQWQPAKSLFEYVQQEVIETCASTIEDEEWRNDKLCEVHVEVHGLWGTGLSEEEIKEEINSFLKDRWAVKSVNANEGASLVVVGLASEDAVDKACACQEMGGHVVTIIPTSRDRWDVYCAEDVVPDARDYSDWFDDDGVAEGYGDNGPDTLLSCVTRDFAKCIIERRRTQERSIRTLRVVAQRAHVPIECARHIEAYAALSARDAIPCQRAQLPAFMERLVDKYRELRWDSDLSDAFVSSGFMGSDEIWKGSFGNDYGGEMWTLFPRKLLKQYRRQRSSFGYDEWDEPEPEEDMAWFVERPPGPGWTPEGG